ncbi:MAG TPA: hypothetical protein VFX69_13870, partial [Steroidobacteraceae bacterium]|nr:hypothetical protein [Steroidobacteraceae bacterium]
DARINRIFEGSSQVMHLIMAREALDTHFRLMMPILQPKPGQKGTKRDALLKALGFYSSWLPKLFLPQAGGQLEARHLDERNRRHLEYAAKASKLLARRLFATMARHGPKLEKEQILLGNFVDVGVELFVMAATLSYADHLVAAQPGDRTPLDLADLYCQEARRRIESNFRAVKHNFNRSYGKVAGLLMDGKLDWLGEGAANPIPPQYRDWVRNDYEHPSVTAAAATPTETRPRPREAA